MKVIIETIPHETHRYSTVGDWFSDFEHTCKDCCRSVASPSKDEELCPNCKQPMQFEERIHIKVSQMPDWRMPMLVAVHELVEVLLCKQAGVTTEQVDAFDMQFEKDRKEGKVSEIAEPGDAPGAPYEKQHGFASSVERMMAAEMGVNWELYAQQIESMP